MATGVAVVCGAVKDAPGVVTELAPDGAGGWLLSGRKTLVSLAPLGTHFFVHAQRRVDVGPTRFVVPLVRRDTPGFAVLDDSGGLGMRASGTVDIVFDRCPVPADEILVRAPEPAGGRNDAVLAYHTVSSITMLGIYAARRRRRATWRWGPPRAGRPIRPRRCGRSSRTSTPGSTA